MKISEVKVGDRFSGAVLISGDFKEDMTKATPPQPYFSMQLGDKTKSFKAVYFGVPNSLLGVFSNGMLVYAEGMVQEYRGDIQLKLDYMHHQDKRLDGLDLSDFAKQASKSEDEVDAIITRSIYNIDHPVLSSIVSFLYEENKDLLLKAPAAKKMHHAYLGGLGLHTSSMLGLAEYVISTRPFLNGSLLRAGVILHDMEKIFEMTHNLGIVSDYSFKGKLLGHIVMGVESVNRACDSLGIDSESEIVLLLKHLILSHHNLGEWGSPVQPHCAEAVALHYIDQLDAKLQMAEDALVGVEVGEFSAPVYALEKAELYQHYFPEGPKKVKSAEDLLIGIEDIKWPT